MTDLVHVIIRAPLPRTCKDTMSRIVDVTTSALGTIIAAGRGATAFRPARLQPAKPLELYEYEASPYCRLVRESLTEMELDAIIRPCPHGGKRHRPAVKQLGGKFQFPFLVDPNSGKAMYESAEIVEYLAQTYRGATRPARGLRRGLAITSSALVTVVRTVPKLRGFRARPSKTPELPLELYSFEASPYSRLVREVLTELEIPYLLRNTGKARWGEMGPPWVRAKLFPRTEIASRNRQQLHALTGRLQLPYLIDPNTGTNMFESAAIIRYLEAQYGA